MKVLISIGSNTTWTNLEELLYLHTNLIGDKGAVAIGSNTTWIKLNILDLSRKSSW